MVGSINSRNVFMGIKTNTIIAQHIKNSEFSQIKGLLKQMFVTNGGQIIGLQERFIKFIEKALCNDGCFGDCYYCCDNLVGINQNNLRQLNINQNNLPLSSDDFSILSTEIVDDNESTLSENLSLNDFEPNDIEQVNNVKTGKIGEDNNLLSLTPLIITESNLSKGTWLLVGNIQITIPSGTIWKNTNLKVYLGDSSTNVVSNGEINYRTPNSNEFSSESTISYSYNIIFSNQISQNLNIMITSEFESISANSNPTLNSTTNYFLTKLN